MANQSVGDSDGQLQKEYHLSKDKQPRAGDVDGQPSNVTADNYRKALAELDTPVPARPVPPDNILVREGAVRVQSAPRPEPAPARPPEPAPPPPASRTQPNARRLAAAHAHLDRMFADAEGEQIEGRKFWGKIKLAIPFQDGSAQEIQASKEATDRVAGVR